MTSCHFFRVIARRTAVLLSFFAVTACLLAADAASEKRAIDVPGDTVENAIKKLSLQTGVDILVLTKDVRGIRSRPIKGEYATREALELVLADTDLIVEQAATSRILTVRMANTPQEAKKKTAGAGPSGEDNLRPESSAGSAGNVSAVGGRRDTATITGRVFNIATGIYLKSAEVRAGGTGKIVYTEEDGSYAIAVPPGEVTLTVAYASVQTATASTIVSDGGSARLDFDLEPLLLGSATEGDVVKLDAFTVSAEREGQAKAIMEQRAAPNAVTVIATDNFGNLTLGALGEFLRYMPGIALDGDSEPDGVRVAGLDPKYTSFTRDGVSMASAQSEVAGNSRQFNLLPISVTGIESIEFNHTLTASMDAGGAAGAINLKSKNSFNRRKDSFIFSIGMNGHGNHIDMSRHYMPDDRKHFKSQPNFQLSYGGVFAKRRLGIEFNASRHDNYVPYQWSTSTFAYRNPDTALWPNGTHLDGPVITGIQFMTAHHFRSRVAASLNADYKLSSKIVLSFRSDYSYYENEMFTSYQDLWARVASGLFIYGPADGYDPASTHSHIVAHNSNNMSNRVEQRSSSLHHHRGSYFLSPRLAYKSGPLAIDLRLGFSRADVENTSGDRGYFASSGLMMSRVGWEASRPNSRSPEWTLNQLPGEGDTWSNPDNWQRNDSYGTPQTLSYVKNYDQVSSAYLDITRAFRVFGHPVAFKTGIGGRDKKFKHAGYNRRYTYVGETYDQRQAIYPWAENYVFTYDLNGKGGNIDKLGWPVLNNTALYSIFKEHPGQFNPDTVENLRRDITFGRDLAEEITAAYLETNTRFGNLRLNAGIRGERTVNNVKVLQMRTDQEIIDAGLATNTVEGILYRYHDGERLNRRTSYENLFLSGGIKYDFSKNLRFQLSASQSILRPDYNNLAGVINYPDSDYTTEIWVPNPLLKPERATKYYASLVHTFKPAGTLSVSAYRLDIDDKQIGNIEISAAQASLQVGAEMDPYTYIPDNSGGGGAGDDDNQRPGYVTIPIRYRSTTNASDRLTIHGLVFEYNQQFTFLPGFLKGLSVFSSLTLNSLQNARTDYERVGNVKRSANGGIRYRYGRFNVQLRASWRDDTLNSVTRPTAGRYYYQNDLVYLKGYTVFDIAGGFRLNSRYELTFGVRNPLNTPLEYYSRNRDQLYAYRFYGATWNLNLKATF